MRIVSQDGIFDFPYEKCCIWLDENSKCVKLSPIGEPDSNYVFGLYSTEEKAQKAMEMLHKEYGKHFFGQGGAMATANLYVPAFAFIPPKVFQFPQDEDVEV